MTMYNLAGDKTMPFELYDTTTEEVIFSRDLIQMIKDAYQAGGKTPDFDAEHEFFIELNFAADLQVEITINGWTYKPQETIF
jgi:hypothetical protein